MKFIGGVNETNQITDEMLETRKSIDYGSPVFWDTDGLYISRLRLLSDPGFPFWDVSYCYGELDGCPVLVALPFSQLPKRGMRKALYSQAKASGKFIRGLFDNISTLN